MAGRINKEYKYSVNPRPLELLTLLATTGVSLEEAAAHLHISIHTVNQQMAHIRKALRVHSNCQAVYRAVGMGLIPLEKDNPLDIGVNVDIMKKSRYYNIRGSYTVNQVERHIKEKYPMLHFRLINERGDVELVLNNKAREGDDYTLDRRVELLQDVAHSLENKFNCPIRVIIASASAKKELFAWLSSDKTHVIAHDCFSEGGVNVVKVDCSATISSFGKNCLMAGFVEANYYARGLSQKPSTAVLVMPVSHYPAVIYICGCALKLSRWHLKDLNETTLGLYHLLAAVSIKGEGV